MASGTGDVEAEELPDEEEENEGDHPQPHPPTHAPAPRIARREQPQGVAHPRPAKGALLAPDEDQGQNELPDEPCEDAEHQDLNSCCIPRVEPRARGATIQARTAIGMVAAANTARI